MKAKPDWMAPVGQPWTRGAPRPVYDNPWINVTEYDAVAPTGKPALYGLVRMKFLALGVLPLHDDGTVTLVGQHRFAHEDYSWEIPEGGGPVDGDPLQDIQRELAEEAGLMARDWRRILSFQLSNSVTTESGFCFLAMGLEPVAETAHADDTEAFALARVPFREALDQAMAGHLMDMITIATLLRVYHMAREGELSGALTRAML
jgi:8-oxo-dGTP pyrophosphatase MutT (NUDIX family)